MLTLNSVRLIRDSIVIYERQLAKNPETIQGTMLKKLDLAEVPYHDWKANDV